MQPVSKRSTEEQLKQREKYSEGNRHKVVDDDASMRSMMTHMMKMAPKEKLKNMFGPLAAREMPSFHVSYPKECGWPKAVDPVQAAQLLEAAYSNTANQPWMTAHAMRTGDYKFEFEDWRKRFGFSGLGLERLRLVFEEGRMFKPGDVLDKELGTDWTMQYDHRIRNSFANCLNRKEILHLGTVHVAVGFNDLGTLLTADVRPAPDGYFGPLRFVGYEMNAFNVAKSQIIVTLLKDVQVPLTTVLQIWYSSAWSRAAEKAFRSAAGACAKNAPDEVKTYLSHWISTASLPLEEARAKWLEYHDAGRDWSAVGCMTRHKDRMALCHYYLTGDVAHEVPDTGSLAMWSVPAGAPPLEKGESAFNAVSTSDLQKEIGTKKGPDVMAALQHILLGRLQRLRNLLGSDLQVDLRVGTLTPQAAVVHEIAAMQPWTMSWSNLLDHSNLKHFHAMARACSIHGDTIHYGYSMNWITGVFGTCIMDFPQDMRGNLLDMTEQGLVESGKMSFEGIPPLDMLFVLPPFDTPLNYTQYVLSMPHHMAWAEYFCSPSFGSPAPRLAQASPLDGFCPLHQAPLPVSLTWTYDETVNFAPIKS